MEEFLYEVPSDYEEVYGDPSQEPSTDIGQTAMDDGLEFDWHSLEKLKEIVTKSIEESDDESSKSNDEFLESDNDAETLRNEFENPVPFASKNDTTL
ncbi:1919_t:CDS:1, partial [Cetraspora pellucida]